MIEDVIYMMFCICHVTLFANLDLESNRKII